MGTVIAFPARKTKLQPMAKRPTKTRGAAPAVSKAKRPPDADLVITKDGGELTVFIEGTRVAADKGAAALLACLIENIGCVLPFERLALDHAAFPPPGAPRRSLTAT
jgi:hypothetical protein